MNPVLEHDRVALVAGDSRRLGELLAPGSIDAVVCDPPYELGFMGKTWDASGIANDVELWRAVLAALKPGGHLLAFGGTRTYHRMTCAIEDAGFEIRDSLHWFYGTGFPKSLNVSKAIDKRRKDDVRPVCRFLRAAMERQDITSAAIAAAFGVHSRMVDHWAARDTDSQPTVPTLEQWDRLKGILILGPEMDAEVERLNSRKGSHGEDYVEAEIVGERANLKHPGDVTSILSGCVDATIRAPKSEAARQWFGFGTALKPGHEPVVLARKPGARTLVDTVLEHGTGVLNINACRLEEDRWPSNVLLDEDAANELDGQREGASRFFFAAKPTRRERDFGCEGLPVRTAGQATDREEDTAGLNSPRAGAGRTGGARNYHPTVKPIALMRYLCRLVCPPGGTVLDPFTGSGSTIVGALAEGFSAVGFELSPEYAEIAKARVIAQLSGSTEASSSMSPSAQPATVSEKPSPKG